MHATPRDKAGFTLIEVLVVIGIIGVLTAILLPALSRVRASSRGVACAAGQREVGHGIVLRAADHDGYAQALGTIILPPGDERRVARLASLLGDDQRGRYSYRRLDPLSLDPVDAALLAPDADLAAYVGDFGGYRREGEGDPLDDGSPWRCPEVPLGYHQYDAYYHLRDDYFTVLADPRPISFAFNEGFFGVNPIRMDPRRMRGQLVAARRAAQTVWMGDAGDGGPPAFGGTFTWAPRFDEADTRPGLPVPLAATLDSANDPRVYDSPPPDPRHPGGANLLFADGHAETLPATADGLGGALLAAE